MKLDDLELEMVTGGSGQDWGELVKRAMANTEDSIDGGDDGDFWSHSKKSRGKLYRR